MAEVHGNRTTAENAGETAVAIRDGAEYGALLAETPSMDTELQTLIDAWPKLSNAVKTCIVAMVRATERE